MKFTLEWLKSHLETDMSLVEITDTLTMIGLEVESVEDRAAPLAPFTIAHVISAEKHPNADKLKVCLVDTGQGDPVKVVCGAPNARAGMKGVFAATGTYIPGTDFTLQKGVIRGEESNGMLCSERELLISDSHDGIIELPADAPVGARYVDVMGIEGVTIDIAITPNRGDCTGVYGIARDLAAAGIGTLKTPPVAPVPSTAGETPVPIELRFENDTAPACRMFAGRQISGVSNGPSPQWLQDWLRAVGLRPINALADITNFISLDRGRPLHVYDADKLKGTLHARMGRKGESFAGLDNKTHQIDDTMCVIADGNGVLGLGGILGGESTGCTAGTTNVLIECAWFDPMSIARTGRKTGITSDARYRFERTVDPAFVRPGLELATQMILDLCGGEAHEPRIAGGLAPAETRVTFPLSETARLTGLDIPAKEARSILDRLGMTVSGSGDTIGVQVPSWRSDIAIKADIVEEIMRMTGVDNVPVTPLPRLTPVATRILTVSQSRRRNARRALAARGLMETMTWSFITRADAEKFGGGIETLELANPISAELTDMRPSLLPGLLGAAMRNQNRGHGDLGLFEVGQIFLDDTPSGQHAYASAIRTGTATLNGAGRDWRHGGGQVDFFDTKSDLSALLDAMGYDIDSLQLVPEPPLWAHPGRGASVKLGPKVTLATLGELHPALREELGLTGSIVGFELDLDALPQPRRKPARTRPSLAVSDLMPLSRDFAFLVDREVSAETILKAARTADRDLISKVSLFDVYEGEHAGPGKKSVAIEVTFQPREKTLAEEEIDLISQSIIDAVIKTTGGKLRSQ